jgi:hypothetical protein
MFEWRSGGSICECCKQKTQVLFHCECGSIITYRVWSNIKKHKKTKKHLKNMSEIYSQAKIHSNLPYEIKLYIFNFGIKLTSKDIYLANRYHEKLKNPFFFRERIDILKYRLINKDCYCDVEKKYKISKHFSKYNEVNDYCYSDLTREYFIS